MFFVIFLKKHCFFCVFLYFCTCNDDGKEENYIHTEPYIGYAFEG